MAYHNQWGNWSMGGLWPASVTNVRILPSWTYQGILSIKNTVHGPEQKSILYSKFMNSDLNITMNDKVYLCYTCDIEDTIKNHDTCTLFISLCFKFFSSSLTEPHQIFNGKWSVWKYFQKSFNCFATICNLLFKAFYLLRCKTPLLCYVNLLINWYMYVTYLCK